MIPTQDATLRAFADNFNTKITATPANYGLVVGNATSIDSIVTPFLTAYDALVSARASNTATPALVLSKDESKAAMLVGIRHWAQTIRNNPTVSDAHKIELGLTLTDTVPTTPVSPPTSHPIVSVRAPGPLTHIVTFADSDTPTLRRRPPGTIGMEVYVATGTTAAADHTTAVYSRIVTRQPFTFEFSADDRGKVATYFARWITRRGDQAPWSGAVALAVP